MLRRTLAFSAVALALVVTAGLATRSRAPRTAPTTTPAVARMTPERAIEALRLPAYVQPAEIRDTGAQLEYAPPSRSTQIRFDESRPAVTIGQFTMTPVGSFGPARADAGRVIYDGLDASLVYAPSPTGIKEDLVLYANPGTSDFAWSLQLDPAQEARLLDDGSIGIFEASEDAYKGVKVCDQKSADLIALGRKNQSRDRLAYRLPPPVVYDAQDRGAPARFTLIPGYIGVHVEGLENLTYPVTVDPDVIITSSSEFITGGNNEMNVNFRPSGEIRRGTIGGAMGAWTVDVGMPFSSGRYGHQSVAYNGYLYVVGGFDNGSYYDTVEFAPINNLDGSIGAFSSTTPYSNKRAWHGCVARNGFMYVIGGQDSGGSYADVQVAPINSNGTLGAWSTTTALPDKRWSFGVAVWGTFIYVISGEGTAGLTTEVLYNNIRPSGVLGNNWITTQSAFFSKNGAAIAANGFLYMSGGNDGSFDLQTVQVSKINGLGDLAGWSSTSSLNWAISGHGLAVMGGYLVAFMQNSVQLAPLGPSGELGHFRNDISYSPELRRLAGVTSYNNVLYVTGGDQFGVLSNSVMRGTMTRAGTAGNGIGSGNSPIARWNHGAVAWNGFIYVIGGNTDPAATILTANVSYTSINPSTGSVNLPWITSTAPLPVPRAQFGIAVYGSRIFITGGTLLATGTPDTSCIWASLDPNTGANSGWSVTTVMPYARRYHGCVVLNGRLYLIGGLNISGLDINESLYITIGYSGGGFTSGYTSTSSLFPGLSHMACEANRDKIYVMGGQNSTTVFNTVKMGNVNLSTGAIVSWTTLNPLPEVRTDMFSFVANEILYCGTGRATTSASSGLGDMFYATINANGTVSAWTQTQYPFNGINKRLVFRNGVYYVTCGIEGTFPSSYTDTFRLDSSGQVLPWTADSSLPVGNYGMGAAGSGTFIYASGGSSGNSTVYYQATDAQGRLTGAWSTTTPLPTQNQYHRMIARNNVMYSIGGTNIPGACYYAPVNPTTGALGAWISTSSLPNGGVYSHGLVEVGGSLYVVGGYDSGGFTKNTVYRSVINGDGSLAPWTTETAMTFTRAYTSLSVHGGYLYAVGGYDNAAGYLTSIEVAPILPGGSVGAWFIGGTLPSSSYTGHSHAENGYLFASIAYNGNVTRNIFRAALASNGMVGAFNETAGLPQPLYVAQMIGHKGPLYHFGGYNGAPAADVYSAAIATPVHRAIYSREFTFNNDKELLSIEIGGNTSIIGTARLLVYGSTSAANSFGIFPILFDPNVNFGNNLALGNTLARYVLVVLDLDDTLACAMNQDFTIERDITDITLTYNTRPAAPTGLDQRENAGALSIPQGGGANDGSAVATGVTFRSTTVDEDGDPVILRIEYQPIPVAFSPGAGTPSGSSPLGAAGLTDLFLTSGLTPGTRYHWRAWVNDALGAQSPFVSFGSPFFENTTTDFYMDRAPNNPDPNAGGPTAGQFEADGITTIPEANNANSGTIVFKSVVSDPDGSLNTITYEIEAVQTITAFSGTPTATSAILIGAGPFNSQVTQVFTGGALGQDHHWRARVKDNEGVVSAWISFGVAADGNKDFQPVNASPPTMGALVQRNLPAGTGNPIIVGGETELLSTSVSIEVPLTDPDAGLGGEVKLQLEIRPVGSVFTSPSVGGFAAAMGIEPTVFFETSYVPNPVTAMITVAGLADGSYHWQVRSVDNTPVFQLATLWTGFGGDNENPPSSPACTDFYL